MTEKEEVEEEGNLNEDGEGGQEKDMKRESEGEEGRGEKVEEEVE